MNPTPEELKAALHAFVKAEGDDRSVAANAFADLLKKAKNSKSSSEPDEGDCPDDVEDCGEVRSPCCDGSISNVFGTLPLQVECRICGIKYYLGDLVRKSLKREKNSSEV